ncbi:MAG TPA: hypothetical protein VFV52_02320 [Bacilli bacterium]|nr:hypothetical protein [Bacilli bacterium]
MCTMTKERRRTINRFVVSGPTYQSLRVEQLMSQLSREVDSVREELPELEAYQLYDLTFSFQENGLLLQMEFRR